MTNYALAIKKIYPDARPNIDFVNVEDEDGTQRITEWTYTQPQPTVEELETAWNEYVANPPEEPLTEIEQLKKNQELMQEALDDLLLGGL